MLRAYAYARAGAVLARRTALCMGPVHAVQCRHMVLLFSKASATVGAHYEFDVILHSSKELKGVQCVLQHRDWNGSSRSRSLMSDHSLYVTCIAQHEPKCL